MSDNTRISQTDPISQNQNSRKLVDPSYLGFPFRVTEQEPVTARRQEHVKQQIEQVLFTNPLERVFNPEFGVGVRSLVFEPNSAELRSITEQRLVASLTEALLGEVDPRTLEVSIASQDAKLIIDIAYRLATIDRQEQQQFVLEENDLG